MPAKQNQRKPRTSKEYLTSTQAARLCSVASRTVCQWCDKGWLAHHRLPGSQDRRIRPADLRAFLVAHKCPIPRDLAIPTYRLVVGATADELTRLGPGWHAGDVFDLGAYAASSHLLELLVTDFEGTATAVSLVRRALAIPGAVIDYATVILSEDAQLADGDDSVCEFVRRPVDLAIFFAALQTPNSE